MAGNNLNNPAPTPWRINPQRCCIYKIPRDMRQGTPEAYRPQKVLIGPLTYEELGKARANPGGSYAAEYLNMEDYKSIYLDIFESLFETDSEGLKSFICGKELQIRASYSESTAWIPHQDFVDMIYRDSVFILEFVMRSERRVRNDPLNNHREAITKDLMLLENQLPFFIFEYTAMNWTRELFISYFGGGEKKVEGEIKHFTDLLRRVYVDTLVPDHLPVNQIQQRIHNAAKLEKVGMNLEAVSEEPSLLVIYGNGSLQVPRFTVDQITEVKIRNIMALEQRHYQDKAYVCNYIMLLRNLVKTERDVHLLAEKGILTSTADYAMVAKIIQNLNVGLNISVSYLANITRYVNNYYKERNGFLPILKRTYFSNLWSTTAFIVAAIIVISTVGAFIVVIIEATN